MRAVVQGFNARTLISGKSLPVRGGEGDGFAEIKFRELVEGAFL
jgi:hypothetical protein